MDGAVTLADIDKDGDLDLTLQGTLDNGVGYLEIYKNGGNFAFSPWRTWTGASVSSIPIGSPLVDQLGFGEHAWADIDRDGDLDLIAVGWSDACSEFTTMTGPRRKRLGCERPPDL